MTSDYASLKALLAERETELRIVKKERDDFYTAKLEAELSQTYLLQENQRLTKEVLSHCSTNNIESRQSTPREAQATSSGLAKYIGSLFRPQKLKLDKNLT